MKLLKIKTYNRIFVNSKAQCLIASYQLTQKDILKGMSLFILFYSLNDIERILGTTMSHSVDIHNFDGIDYVELAELTQYLEEHGSDDIKHQISEHDIESYKTINFKGLTIPTLVSNCGTTLVSMEYVLNVVNINVIDLREVCFDNQGSENYLTLTYFKSLIAHNNIMPMARKASRKTRKAKRKSFAQL